MAFRAASHTLLNMIAIRSCPLLDSTMTCIVGTSLCACQQASCCNAYASRTGAFRLTAAQLLAHIWCQCIWCRTLTRITDLHNYVIIHTLSAQWALETSQQQQICDERAGTASTLSGCGSSLAGLHTNNELPPPAALQQPHDGVRQRQAERQLPRGIPADAGLCQRGRGCPRPRRNPLMEAAEPEHGGDG